MASIRLGLTRGEKAIAWIGLIIIALIVGRILIVQHQHAKDAEYEASPEGQRELARQEAEAERDAAIEVGIFMVKMSLRDPDSAVFEGLRIVGTGEEKVLCGLVNSRNGFGGMSGPTLFAYKSPQTYVLGDGPEAASKIGEYCGR